MTDIEKIANRLPLNMVRSLTWWCEGGEVREDVEHATKRGLVNRGLVTWTEGPTPKLTPFGEQVREFLLAKAVAEEQARLEALAEKLTAERKIRDEGYEAGVRFAEQRDGDKVENLLKQLQILVSRYPDCETTITFEEMKELSDGGVMLAQPVEDGIQLTVRQR